MRALETSDRTVRPVVRMITPTGSRARELEPGTREQPFGDQQMARFTRMLKQLTAGGYPALNETIDSGVWDVADPPDAEFDFALGRALDGIQALIDSR